MLAHEVFQQRRDVDRLPVSFGGDTGVSSVVVVGIVAEFGTRTRRR